MLGPRYGWEIPLHFDISSPLAALALGLWQKGTALAGLISSFRWSTSKIPIPPKRTWWVIWKT